MNQVTWAAAVMALAAMLLGCTVNVNGATVNGSGTMKTEQRNVEGFTGIALVSAAEVTVDIGEKTAVSVTADDNILPLITTELKGEDLVISSQGSYSVKRAVQVRITVPALHNVLLSGSGVVTITGLSEQQFKVRISGSGDIDARGSAEKLAASVSGSGALQLAELKAKSADASITGSGSIELTASDELKATISGSGDITYHGSPAKVQRRVTGSGKLIAK